MWHLGEAADMVFTGKGVRFLKCHYAGLNFQGLTTEVRELAYKSAKVQLNDG